ncbi:MAG: TolB family protein [Tumebacillaceae bacterium]
MIRFLLFFLIGTMLMHLGIPVRAQAEPANRPPLKAAFIREGHLWIKTDEAEVQVTQAGKASEPKWSSDGKWVAFYKDREIWAYDTEARRPFKVAPAMGADVYGGPLDARWSPAENILAFKAGLGLNLSDLRSGQPKPFQNVAGAITGYAWLPDGTGFLASSQSCPMPDSWTSPVIFKIPLAGAYGHKKMERVFTIPSLLKNGSREILSMGTSTFKWSGDRKWIAFIVTTTGSMSNDANLLCVLSADGKTFRTVDVMLDQEEWFRWAPFPARLGYIGGEGRLWLKNVKDLKVRDITALLPLRLYPSVYHTGAFAFGRGGEQLYVSLDKQFKPSDKPWLDRPKPALYKLFLPDDRMIQLTNPPAGWGDFNPHFLYKQNRIVFVRSNEKRSDAWMANTDGHDAKRWIENIENDVEIYGERNT